LRDSIEVIRTERATVPTARSRPSCPQSGVETAFAQVLAEVMRVDQVPVDGHVFDDLGADSMTMTQFCARVRKRPDLPAVSMKDVYQHPTIRALATALATPVSVPTRSVVPSSTESATSPGEPVEPAGRAEHVLCGTLQFLIFLGYSALAALLADWAAGWIADGSTVLDVYLRAVASGGAGIVGLGALPIVAKWVLIGRWKPQQIRIWSLGYVRFWVVKTLVRANPLALFLVGSPLYSLYLRALGAKVGRRVVILSRYIPVCTDLLAIGDDTVIRKDTFFIGYRARAGVIETGPVTLGREVFIGEKAVLDIGTEMGDGAQLGHTSSLYTGQVVPAGGRWHGSPAQPTELDYLRVAPADCSTYRRVGFSVATLLKLLLVYLPLAEGGLFLLLRLVPSLDELLQPGTTAVTSPWLYIDGLVLSAVLFFGFVVVGLLFVTTVPRLLDLFIKPDRVYPLYGFHYGLHRSIARMTNIKLFTWLFGDSSYIVYYLKALGYDLNQVEQTGSNFGTEVRHESPYLSSVGSGTMVADGLSMMNADYSSSSFRLARTSIGPHNFLGNNIAYPPGGRTGDNCLIATKAMVPLDGEIREGMGLLGSPPFPIPRSVERDNRLQYLGTGDELRVRLAGKNRYNLRSMVLFLLVRWLHVCLLTTIGLAALDLEGKWAFLAFAVFIGTSVVISPLYFALVERAFTFRPLQPRYCSIYDPYFWWHERLWKVPDGYLNIFSGTPFKSLIWRMLGVRIGRRVFDDGVFITERTLAAIGDGSALNVGSKIQCHSQEDGIFKSDHITIGAGATLAVGAFVHYGVKIGDGAVLEADSFLMKGEEIPPSTRWGGNPATELPARTPVAQTSPHAIDRHLVHGHAVAPRPRTAGGHPGDGTRVPGRGSPTAASSGPSGPHHAGQQHGTRAAATDER
jgi:non-ribosomal peptide synthetase-like protein